MFSDLKLISIIDLLVSLILGQDYDKYITSFVN